MGAKFSKDSYYASYETSFERLEAQVDKLKVRCTQRQKKVDTIKSWHVSISAMLTAAAAIQVVWVNKQPPGTYTASQHFYRVCWLVLIPILALLSYQPLLWFFAWGMRHDQRKLAKLADTKRKMLKELRESVRYDRVHQLITKYDPDQQLPALTPLAFNFGTDRASDAPGTPVPFAGPGRSPRRHTTSNAANLTATAVVGASKALWPMFDQLSSKLIGDDPVLMQNFRAVQQQLEEAEGRAHAAVGEADALRRQNDELQRQLQELRQRHGDTLPLSDNVCEEQPALPAPDESQN